MNYVHGPILKLGAITCRPRVQDLLIELEGMI